MRHGYNIDPGRRRPVVSVAGAQANT